jgi:ribosomal protein S18 acetylase RimI-like enzyme
VILGFAEKSQNHQISKSAISKMHATIVTSTNELEQILQLQHINLVKNVDATEISSEGFLTMEHTLDVLQQMHHLSPSVIIKDGNTIAAYALVMLRECRQLFPPLEPMFAVFDRLQWKGKPLNDHRFYVMGQVCVAKAYRGQGLFDLLYQHHKTIYGSQYDMLVTEVATRNQRSMRAHERVGFTTIYTYRDELDEWAVVAWDWNT